MDFVEFLEWKTGGTSKRGSAEALLPHAGCWRFEPGELEEILADIERLREMENS